MGNCFMSKIQAAYQLDKKLIHMQTIDGELPKNIFIETTKLPNKYEDDSEEYSKLPNQEDV